jgi:hypothetical protein
MIDSQKGDTKHFYSNVSEVNNSTNYSKNNTQNISTVNNLSDLKKTSNNSLSTVDSLEYKQLKKIETYVKIEYKLSKNIFTTYHNHFIKTKEEENLLDIDDGEFLQKSVSVKKNQLKQNKIIFLDHNPYEIPFIEEAKEIKEKETKKLRVKLLQEKFVFENNKEKNLLSKKSLKILDLNKQIFQLKWNEDNKSKEPIKSPCKCFCF